MIQPDEEIQRLSWRMFSNLEEVLDALKAGEE